MLKSIHSFFVFVIFSTLVTALTPAPAHALFKLGVAGLANLGLQSTDVTGGSVKGGLGFGGGALLELGPLGVEVLYVSRATSSAITTSGVSTSATTSASFVDVPVMYRMGLGPISFGVGGFASLPMASGGTTNYGAVAGPRLSIPGGLILDARVMYGLVRDAGSSQNPLDAQVLLGFAFL